MSNFMGKSLNVSLSPPEMLLHSQIGETILMSFAAREHAILMLSDETTKPSITYTEAEAFVDGYIKKISEAYNAAEPFFQEQYTNELKKARAMGAEILGNVPEAKR
jgi:hypothetical protein